MKSPIIAMAMIVMVMCALAEGAEMVIRLGHDNNVQEPGHEAFLKFKALVEEGSGGRMEVHIFPGGQLGNVQDMFEQTRRGDIQMSVGATTLFVQTIPEFAVWDGFYMFDDAAHAHRVLDGKAGVELMKPLERMRLVGIGYMEIGFRNFSNNKRPIEKAKDVAGLKIRGYSPLQIRAWEAAGASLTSLAWPEVFTSLQQNLIDGQECATSSFYNARFYEAQKYWTLTRHAYTNWLWYANRRFMDALSKDDRALIVDSAREAILMNRQLMAKSESGVLEELKGMGIQINELPLEERHKLAKEMNRAVSAAIIDRCGKDIYEMVWSEIAAARQ